MGRRGNGEGSIYQDGRGLWRAAVSLPSGKRKYLSGKTRQDVAKKLNAAIETREKGLPLPGLRLSTVKYLNDWLEQTVAEAAHVREVRPGRQDSYHARNRKGATRQA